MLGKSIMLKLLIKLTFLPVFLILGNGLAIYLVTKGYSETWLVLLIIVFVGASFSAEKLLPYDRIFNKAQQDRSRDFIHALVNESFNIIGLVLLPFMTGMFVWLPIWPSQWPLAAELLLAILLADIGITLMHYASHRSKWLWRLHAVHHSVKRMYGFNGLMKHPLHQLIETLAGAAPLLIIGIPHDVLLLLVVAVVLQLLLQHSNVNYSTGPFKKILAVNTLHRFHHLKDAKEGNVNFGLFTTLTDRLLGTFFYEPKRMISIEDIGIGAEPDYPTDYVDQLKRPFTNPDN